MITSWQVGNSKAHFKRNKCFQGRSVPCSPILHFPLSASTKWLTWSQKSFLEACPQSLGWLSFKATQGCLSLPDGYLFSDSAALGLFTLFRLFKDSEKDGCIFLFKSWETLHTFLSILRRKKKKKSSYQGHLATEDIKHLWVFSTNLKICPLHTHLSPLSQHWRGFSGSTSGQRTCLWKQELQETRVGSLDREDPLGKEITTSVFLPC